MPQFSNEELKQFKAAIQADSLIGNIEVAPEKVDFFTESLYVRILPTGTERSYKLTIMDPYNNIPRYETIQGTVRGNAPENVVKRAAEIAKALDLIGADLSELNFH